MLYRPTVIASGPDSVFRISYADAGVSALLGFSTTVAFFGESLKNFADKLEKLGH